MTGTLIKISRELKIPLQVMCFFSCIPFHIPVFSMNLPWGFSSRQKLAEKIFLHKPRRVEAFLQVFGSARALCQCPTNKHTDLGANAALAPEKGNAKKQSSTQSCGFGKFDMLHHQTFQVSKMEVLTYVSCM